MSTLLFSWLAPRQPPPTPHPRAQHGAFTLRQACLAGIDLSVVGWVPLRFAELDLRFAVEEVVAQVRRALKAAGAPIA